VTEPCDGPIVCSALSTLDVIFFIELGPGNVLAGLLKRTNHDINVMSVGDAESVRKCEGVL